MNPKGETRIAAIFAALILLVIALSLVGCKTKTVTVTEYVNVHDTVTTFRTDTIRDVRVTHHTDTVRQIETHTFTLNNVGDTIKEIHHYHDREKVIVVDSTDRYKATVDSLRAALREAKDKQTVVVKTKKVVRWWEWVVFLGIIGVVLFFVLKRGGKTFVDKIG